ncbi:hypothetical protein FKL07_26245 [Citrobacter freundii]|nr:hypothetical protein [Citrobacter freundii]
MTASRITHLITSCTKGKHFQCGSRAELSIRAGETPEEAMASWAATIRRSQRALLQIVGGDKLIIPFC